MLVLSRKRGEEIVIGDQIVIRVLRIDGGRVRLGLEAPAELLIRRSELDEADPRLAAASELAALAKIPR